MNVMPQGAPLPHGYAMEYRKQAPAAPAPKKPPAIPGFDDINRVRDHYLRARGKRELIRARWFLCTIFSIAPQSVDFNVLYGRNKIEAVVAGRVSPALATIRLH